MVMSWIFTGIVGFSMICATITGNGKALSQGVLVGANKAIELAISMAGSICLWCGLGKLMQANGMTEKLAKLLRPMLTRLFPSAENNKALAGYLSANICANILGLGNAATPMGIQAAQTMARNETADNELCRLVVLNTASIQLIPATVAAVRAGLGSAAPFDILPAVWITSILSTASGLLAAYMMGRVWKP